MELDDVLEVEVQRVNRKHLVGLSVVGLTAFRVLQDIDHLTSHIRTVFRRIIRYHVQRPLEPVPAHHAILGILCTGILEDGWHVIWGEYFDIAGIAEGQYLMKTCFLIITDITVLQFLDKLAVLIDLCHIKRKAFALLIDYGDLDRLAALSIDIQVQRVELLEETGAQHVKDGQFAVLMLVQCKVVVEPQMVQFVTEVNAINQAVLYPARPGFCFH